MRIFSAPLGFWISTLVLLVSLTGCTPRPKTPQFDEPPPSPQGKASLGSFNLQKRHGLGGWDHSAGPSERELLRAMAGTADRQEQVR